MQPLADYNILCELYTNKKISLYRGIKRSNKEPLILKVLNDEHPNQEDIAHLKHEYNLIKGLNLPGVLRTYGLERREHHYELLLEDIPEGYTLREMITTQKISINIFLSLGIKLAQALHELHSAHIIHKDINPNNILVSKESGLVKIIDFSIATQLSQEVFEAKNPEVLEGSLPYMSPEQTSRMNRVIDERTDLYSLGVTFYEMLTGQLPFTAQDPMEWIHCHIAKKPVPPHKIRGDIPVVLSNIIMKLLAKAAEDRYASAFGLKVDLEQCLISWQRMQTIKPFPLGQKDVGSSFHIPQKLYGRENEVRSLLNVFERISKGKRELLLVSGSAGIGKTSLINEIQKPIVRQRGYFTEGKFEQFHRSPYGALIQAFRKLIQQILSENEKQIEHWRNQLLLAISPNAQVIIEVIPELERLVGKQPRAQEVAFPDARNRFELVFFDFVRVFAQPEHPLVIFLDDMQWSDVASCSLISQLLRDRELHHFLLIGAYRDKEVDSHHPLMAVKEDLKKAGMKIPTLKLEALDLLSVNQLVSDTLSTTIDSEHLAKLIYEKTSGNPFFVKAFLQSLYKDHYLSFDKEVGHWMWDLGTLRTLAITENVVDLIISKIERLPLQVQEILKVAACIGNQFDLETLSSIYNQSLRDTAKILWDALQENFIVPLDEDYKFAMDDNEYAQTKEKIVYKFSHDRIQQAAFSMLNESQRKTIILKIARILLDKSHSAEQEEKKLFEIVNYFNGALDLLSDPEEKIKVAELNLKAGQKAKQSAAFDHAAAYFKNGLSMLNEQSWTSNYNLAFELNFGYAESQHLLTRFEEADALFDDLIARSATPLDRAKIMMSQLLSYEIKSQYDKAIDVGIKGLHYLGLDVSRNPNIFKVMIESLKAFLRLRKIKPNELLHLPIMQDPEKKLLSALMQRMSISMYLKDPNLFAILAFRSIGYSLRYGNAPTTSELYVTYAIIQMIAFKNYDLAYQYGQVAVKLSESFDNLRMRAIIYAVVAVINFPWNAPYKDSLDLLNKSYLLGRQSGELLHANYSACMIPFMMLLNGEPIADISDKTQKMSDFVEFCNSPENIMTMRIWVRTIQVLTGEQSIDYLQEDLNAFLTDNIPLVQPVGLGAVGIQHLIITYILKDWPVALRIIEKTKVYAKEFNMKVFFLLPEYYFFSGLTLLSVYSQATTLNKWKYKKQIKTCINKLKFWAHHCPMNFEAKYQLLLAGVEAYLKQNFRKANYHYQRSLTVSQEQGHIQLIAIANEFIGRAFLLYEQPMSAKSYLQEAFYGYQQWGLKVKLDLLQKEFPDLFTRGEDKLKDRISSASTSELKSTQALDLTSVLKSAQVISSRVKLNELLRTLIRIMLENAGAERGLVLLMRNEVLFIEAEGHATQPISNILEHKSIERNADLSLSVIQYVQHTQEALVLDDAVHKGAFTEDAYIIKHSTLSLLCMPILQQGKLLGILYLENNLVAGAFTKERLEVLKLLASQVAISLENALLYAAYDQFVPHEFLELLEKRSIVDIGLSDHVQKHMTILFSDIRNFTKLSEKMTPDEVFTFMNEFLGYMEPIIKRNRGFIDKYIGDSIMALFPAANDAVVAGIEMQKELANYNKKRLFRGQEPINIGIGINSGRLILGTLGTENRLETSVLSDAVNVAARIEELTKQYGCNLLISENVYYQLSKKVQTDRRFIGRVRLRGKEEEVAIWEIFSGDDDATRALKQAIVQPYSEAMDLFDQGNYRSALQKFQECLLKLPTDISIKIHIEECKDQIQNEKK